MAWDWRDDTIAKELSAEIKQRIMQRWPELGFSQTDKFVFCYDLAKWLMECKQELQREFDRQDSCNGATPPISGRR